MLYEDIEEQTLLIKPDNENAIINQTSIIKPTLLERIKKNKDNILCDLLIVIILIVCVVATIVIIVCNNSR